MTEWARTTWSFLHTQSFFIDLHEHHGLVPQQAFVDLLHALPDQLPCPECRPHLAAFFQSDPPPRPAAYEPEDYVFATYVWRLHNSVNRRLGKPEPTFAAVVDHYVNGRQDVVCATIYPVAADVGAPPVAKGAGADATNQIANRIANRIASAPATLSDPAVVACGISAVAVAAVVCVAALIFVLIVVCAVMDAKRLRQQRTV